MFTPIPRLLSFPLVAAFAALATLGACSDSTPAAPVTAGGGSAPETSGVPVGTLSVADADPAAGEQHFNLNCAACHQVGGEGAVGLAPSIRNRDFLALASDDFIRTTIASGRGGTAMIPRPDLSGDVVTEIIAYLRDLETPNPVNITVDDSRVAHGDISLGGENYSLFCAYCHGDNGEGYLAGGAGPAIGLPGFLDVASDDYISKTVKHGRLGTAMRGFDGARGLANLNDQEIDDIIVWLRRDK